MDDSNGGEKRLQSDNRSNNVNLKEDAPLAGDTTLSQHTDASEQKKPIKKIVVCFITLNLFYLQTLT